MVDFKMGGCLSRDKPKVDPVVVYLKKLERQGIEIPEVKHEDRPEVKRLKELAEEKPFQWAPPPPFRRYVE